MINYILVFVAFLTGFISKFTDLQEHGLKLKRPVYWSAGLIYGVLIAYAVRLEPVIITLAIGTIIGLVFNKQIDSIAHLLGVSTFVILVLYWGVPEISIVLLVMILLGSTMEEIINNQILDKGKIKNNYVKKFLELRPVLEIEMFVIAMVTGLWPLWYTLFFYDIGYILINRMFNP